MANKRAMLTTNEKCAQVKSCDNDDVNNSDNSSLLRCAQHCVYLFMQIFVPLWKLENKRQPMMKQRAAKEWIVATAQRVQK